MRWLAMLWAISLPYLTSAAELRTLDGKTHSGDLISADAKEVILSINGERKTFPTEVLLNFDLGSPPVTSDKLKTILVELTDGSTFTGESFKIIGKNVALSNGDRTITFPVTTVFYVLRDAGDSKIMTEWRELLTKRGNRDLMVIAKKVDLTEEERKLRPGETQKLVLEALPGTFGDGDEKGEAIAFTLAAGRKLSPKLDRMQALIFVQRQGEVSPTLCRLVDVFGNKVMVRKIEVAKDGLKIETVAGVNLNYPDVKNVGRFDFSRGKQVYLVELDPVKTEEKPRDGKLEVDGRLASFIIGKNPELREIRLKGKPYTKGLSLRTPTSVIYDIAGEYKDFRATVGIDDQVGTDGGESVEYKARLLIEGDGRELFVGEFTRGAIREIAVDIRGVKKLRLTVTSPFLFNGDNLTLGDPYVSK